MPINNIYSVCLESYKLELDQPVTQGLKYVNGSIPCRPEKPTYGQHVMVKTDYHVKCAYGTKFLNFWMW